MNDKFFDRRHIVPLAAITAVVLLLAAWLFFPSGDAVPVPGKSAAAPQMPPVTVEAARARVDKVVVDAEVVGTLLANESVILRPEISGRIDSISFREGQVVQKGATLVTLDTKELRAQLAQSEAAAQLARLNFDRMKDLRAKQFVSQQAYDEAAARLTEAEAKVKLDQARLEKAILRAPFTGMLGVRRVSPGDYVAPGQEIVNLESIDPIKVDLRLPEIYAAKVATGQRLRLRIDAFPGQEFAGEIYVVDPRLDATTRTLLVRARISNAERRLRPGMFAAATIELARREQAVLVPEQALVPSGAEQYVFRVVDGKAARVKVSVGVRRTGEAEILEGVGANDVVVTAGHQKLRDGAPVNVQNMETAAAPPPAAPKTP